MQRTVRYRPRAKEDVVDIVRTIGLTVSYAAATRRRTQIEKVIRDLETDADQWPVADEALELQRDLRFRLVGRRRHVYRILYMIHQDIVTVYRVRHAAQDWLTADDL